MVNKSLILLLSLILISCGATPVSPTVNAPSTSPATSLVLSTAVSGTGYQLTAMLYHSDGTSQDVTTAATWQSSQPSVATVSSTGFVDVLADGEVNVQAIYQSIVGSLRMSVSQARYSISGRVGAAFPSRPPYVANVTVQISGGINAGAFGITDPSGYYTITGLRGGPVDMSISAPGFAFWTLSGLQLIADLTVDPLLSPTSTAARVVR